MKRVFSTARSLRVALILIIALVSLIACAGSMVHVKTSGTSDARRATTGGTGLVLGQEYDGRSVTLHVGQSAPITLDSTTWVFTPPSDVRVLEQSSPVVKEGPEDCRVYQHCGTVSVIVTGRSRGSVTVSAKDYTCGEAVNCRQPRATYNVTININ